MIYINFSQNGGVKQFSEIISKNDASSKIFNLGLNYYQNFKDIINLYKKNNIVFCGNNIVIYLFLIFYVLPFRKRNKIILINHDHRLRKGSKFKGKLLYYLCEIFFNFFDLVIIHENSTPKAKKILERKNALYLHMPVHGINKDYFVKKKCRDENLYDILFFGRLDEDYKNLDFLTLSISKLPKIRLLIAGSGNIKTNTKNIIDSSPNITLINRFIGDYELGDFFSQSSFLILPYLDATQTTLLDLSGYYRTPIILSDLSIFNNNNNISRSIIINCQDYEFFKKDIVEALNIDNDKYNKMSENSYLWYKKSECSWGDYISTLKSRM